MRKIDYDRYAESLRIEKEGSLLTLFLHNPEKLNATTEAMHWSLSRIWDDIDADPEVSVVILTGSGERAFSAGGDAVKMKEDAQSIEFWVNAARESKRIIYGILACEKPIIARLNGHAVGLGASLALAADLAVGVAGAKFGDPHCNTGLTCADGGALLWPQQIGYARAKEFLFTGRLVTMEEAAEIGLINYAVPREELDAKVNELAQAIASNAARAVQMTKAVMNLPLRQAAISSMELGLATEIISSQTEDHMEAANAFIEKREPHFKGR
jgi:enoyl-CoA hydratase